MGHLFFGVEPTPRCNRDKTGWDVHVHVHPEREVVARRRKWATIGNLLHTVLI
jgi:hypothetical protein